MSVLILVCFYENGLCVIAETSPGSKYSFSESENVFFSILLKQNVWRTSSSSIIDILQIYSRVDQLHNYKIIYVPRVFIGL